MTHWKGASSIRAASAGRALRERARAKKRVLIENKGKTGNGARNGRVGHHSRVSDDVAVATHQPERALGC